MVRMTCALSHTITKYLPKYSYLYQILNTINFITGSEPAHTSRTPQLEYDYPSRNSGISASRIEQVNPIIAMNDNMAYGIILPTEQDNRELITTNANVAYGLMLRDNQIYY